MSEAPAHQPSSEQEYHSQDYATWKKNAPLFYDTLYSQGLVWPSLTVDWLPSRDIPALKDEYSNQRLLLGTHGPNQDDGDFNQILIHKVRMPVDHHATPTIKPQNETKTRVNQEKISVDQEIYHEGEVNKARHMPQSHNIIATKTVSGEVHIYDYFKHPTKPMDWGVRPNVRLVGHTSEGYGLSWNHRQEGLIVSGSDDGVICIWDINQLSRTESNQVDPLYMLENSHDGEEIEDVAWSYFDENRFVSVGDDKRIMLWDRRQQGAALRVEDAHLQEIMCVDMSPFDPYLLLTGSMDTEAALWDQRNMTKSIFKLSWHKDALTQAKFSPLQPNLLATSSGDCLVCLWDLAKMGSPPSDSDLREGTPPELFFVHGGHQSRVSDISWNLNEKLTLASVSEDNVLQVWTVAHQLYQQQ